MTTTVHPTAFVAPNVLLGEGSTVGEYTIIGRAPRGKKEGELELVIGPGAVIRPFTTIYAGARIGAITDRLYLQLILPSGQIFNPVAPILVGQHANEYFCV